MKKIFLLAIITLLSTTCMAQSVSKKKHKKVKKKYKTEIVNGLPLNSQWILEKFDAVDYKNITKNSYITINENFKNFSGKGGCNNIGGALIVKENSIKFDKVFATRMYCNNMEQENLFIKNLNETNKYKIVGGELFLYKDDVLLMTLESFRG